MDAPKQPAKPARRPTIDNREKGPRKMELSPSLQSQPLLSDIVVVDWQDPIVEALGHHPESPYIEYVWLSVLGPATVWAYRRLSCLAATAPGSRVDLVDLAVSLGLGESLGPNAPMARTLARMVQFGCAQRAGETFAVRLALPDVPARQLTRLSWSARQAHEQLCAARRARGKAAVPPGSPCLSWPAGQGL